MHIALVGGLDRSEAQYKSLAEHAGHVLETHTGDLAGRGTDTLEALVARADYVVVVTAVNSHGAVWRARKLAKLKNKQCVLMARCGVSRFTALLAELSSAVTTWRCAAQ